MEKYLEVIRESVTSATRRLRRRFDRGRSRFNQLSPEEKKLKTVKLFRYLAMFVLGGVVCAVIAFFALFAYYSKDLPKPGEIVKRQGFSTRMFDRNGKFLYDLYDDERRTPIKFEQVPEHVKQATIAVEDKDFYNHQGFDARTIVRIPYNLIFRGQVVGGSTLSQQLIKLVFLTNEKTLPRKLKELILSIQLERTFTKDQILEMYLNEVSYGGGASGIGTAAEMYFDKSISAVTVTEAAILAGLPQRPSAYSPYAGKTDENGQPLWKLRALGVLRRMREDNYLTDASYQQSISELDTTQFKQAVTNIEAPHFVFYVRNLLEKMYGPEMSERGGLKITTSLDLELQQEAEKIVLEEIQKVEKFKISNGSAMVTNPRTGEIIAMVGSKDYFSKDIDGQYNVAVDGLRQPGSSIKPLTYLAFLQRGFTPAYMFADVETTFAANTTDEPYKPKNYDGKFRGPVSLRTSLGSSLNIPAVKAISMVGVPNFLQLAYDMGFTTLEPSPENLKRFGPALTLGGGEVTLIDSVTAYSAFANGGRKVEPVALLKIEDKDGHVLFEHRQVEGRQVIKPEEAFLINNILSDNTARLLAFGANSLLNTNKPIAVKTGTTNLQKDNWTIGWSQEVMVGVWVGNNDNTSMTQVASGITGASPIWRRIIDAALTKGYKAPAWEVPANVEEVEVDAISGYPSHDGFPLRKEYVIKGTLPTVSDPIHTKLKLCRGENKLANEARISSGDFDEKEFIIMREDDPVSQDGVNRWQESINAWIGGQTDEKYKAPTEYCGAQGDVSIKLNQPENQRRYDSDKVEVNVEAGADDGIEKIEIWVNGGLRETVNDRTYKGTLTLPGGQYEIFAKARSRGGKEVQSGTVFIGTQGQDWKKPEPTPSPSPSPTPTLAPTPTPSPTPTPTPILPI